MKLKDIPQYSAREERLNVLSHGFGAIGAVFGTIALVRHPDITGTKEILSVLAFGLSMVLLYTASTLYHNTKDLLLRKKLNIVDHAAIYVLIAGSYTPFCTLVLPHPIGNVILTVTWSLALIGIYLKLFYTGKYDVLSTIAYVVMGWLIVFVYTPLSENLASEGLQWLFAGGIFYTLGAVLYSISKIPMNHALFHFFVLAGSYCHFYCVYYYVV